MKSTNREWRRGEMMNLGRGGRDRSEYKSLPDPHKPAFRTRSAPIVEDDVFSKSSSSGSGSQGKNRNSRKSKSTTGWSPKSSVVSVPSGEDGESPD
uniref:Uncharacterized protein n=1 Tax=Magallana gigas TaxID=29159 RepID=A0A8W8NEN6_MAGGI